jgi:hypothetical protein
LDHKAAEVVNCVSAARSPTVRKERRNESSRLQRFEDVGEESQHLAAAYGAATATTTCPRAKSGTRRQWPPTASCCVVAAFPEHCSRLTAPFPLTFSHDFAKQHHARL